MPVSSIPWDKYTHLIHFASAPGVANGIGDGSLSLNYLPQAEINELVATKRAGVKVLVCIKDNDKYPNAFAQNTTPGQITLFVKSIAAFINKNHYDGVDIDWEQNVTVAQYISLITKLKSALPGKLVTMAAGDWGGLNLVAGASQATLDQINVMCYDMDNGGDCQGQDCTWYNNALFQNHEKDKRACDQRIGLLTGSGVVSKKIGIGIPFYARKHAGSFLPGTIGSFPSSTLPYRSLATDPLRFQDSYKKYDTGHGAAYLSIPVLNEFISYTSPQSITDAVAWQQKQGFGGFMTFTMEYEFLSSLQGDARYPLSSSLRNATSAAHAKVGTNEPARYAGAPTGTLVAGPGNFTLSLKTGANATCAYGVLPDMPYSDLPSRFQITGGTDHTASLATSENIIHYSYNVRCLSSAGVVNTTDYVIAFDVAPVPAPSVTMTPNAGTGHAQSFTIRVPQSAGTSAEEVDAVFDASPNLANSCWIEFWTPTRTLFLKSDDNASWMQAPLGSGRVLRNSQCSLNVDAAGAVVEAQDLQLTLPVTFSSSYGGARALNVFTADNQGRNTGWKHMGEWNVAPAQAASPLSVAVVPAAGNGSSATFELDFSTETAIPIQQASVFIGAQPGMAASCNIQYWAPSNTLYLRNDTDSAWIGSTLGSGDTLSNRYCAVDTRAAQQAVWGTSLILVLPVTFTGFAGSQNIYTFSVNQSGQTTGWVQSGSFLVR